MVCQLPSFAWRRYCLCLLCRLPRLHILRNQRDSQWIFEGTRTFSSVILKTDVQRTVCTLFFGSPLTELLVTWFRVLQLCILHISFNPGSGVVLRVLSENAIPEDPTYSSLTSFDVSRERDGSNTFEVRWTERQRYLDSGEFKLCYMIQVVTGHSDGKLFFWTVKGLEDNCSAILEECLVPISVIPSSPVVKVAIAYCGRIAFATADHWIFVFELESSGLQFSSEMEFDLLTPREREVESRTQSIRARVLLDWHEVWTPSVINERSVMLLRSYHMATIFWQWVSEIASAALFSPIQLICRPSVWSGRRESSQEGCRLMWQPCPLRQMPI